MLGNMPGQTAMPNSGIMSQPAMPVPIPESPSVPPAQMNQTNPPPFEQNPLGMIMKAVLDPKTAAKELAAAGIGPEQLQQQIQPKNQVSELIQPTSPGTKRSVVGGTPLINPNDPFANANPVSSLGRSLRADQGTTQPPNKFGDASVSQLIQPVDPGIQAATKTGEPAKPFSLAQVLQDLMQPIGQPPVAGQASPGANLPNPPMSSPQLPVAPPVVASPGMPPPGVSPQVPVAPPVVPPPAATTPTPQTAVDDYASGKLKSSVMGGSGGNAPDSQLKGNSIFNEFMSTIKAGGITNPNALAAIAATGKSESGYSEKNVYGSWSDPSESGQAGTSGGVMSWRAERLANMRNFVKNNGGDPNKPSPALQAKFLLQEDPNLIKALNAAKTPEEAQTLMNNAWKFKGYDNPNGGEAARRIALARNFAASGDFGDLSGIVPAADGGTVTGAAGTGALAGGTGTGVSGLSSGLTDPGAGNVDTGLNLPDAPSPIGPKPGQYAPDANVQKLMLMLLTGLSGGGADIPSIAQLMNGTGRRAA